MDAGERLEACVLTPHCGHTCGAGVGRSGVGLCLSACVGILFHFDSWCGFQMGQGKGKGKRFLEVGWSSRLAGGSEVGARAGACGSDTRDS